MSINLLPWREQQIIRNCLLHYLQLFLLVLISIIISITAREIIKHKINNIHLPVNQKNIKTKLKTSIQNLKNQQLLINHFNKFFITKKQAAKNLTFIANSLLMIATKIPNDITLSNIQLDNKVFYLEGISNSLKNINTFINQINSTKTFKKLRVLKITTQSNHLNFRIKML